MKLTEYAFSLNVMFDYNEKDQRAASPAERDEYEDVNRQTEEINAYVENTHQLRKKGSRSLSVFMAGMPLSSC